MQKILFFANGGMTPIHRFVCRNDVQFYMKVYVLGLCIVLLSMGVASSNSMGQHIHRTNVVLGVPTSSLKIALQELEKASGMTIFYPSTEVDKYQNVTLPQGKRTVARALDELLDGTALGYRQSGKHIVLFEKSAKEMQQQKSVRGIVTNALGQPIPAVSITVKHADKLPSTSRASSSTATDQNGHWSLLLPSDTVTLVFSLLGYQSFEAKVGAKTTLDVVLQELSHEIEDVVVTGLFTRKADSFTGSTTTFTQDDVLAAGAQNIVQSLRNLDPAFQITENLDLGSDPNAMPSVQMRGQSGLPDLNGEYSSNPNQPLFILDGFETTLQKVIDLDIYRVKSVTLLKDAASKAIYGSRAANGVVVIETLRPESGKLRLTYSANLNVQLADLSSYNLTNARQKLQAEVLAGIYDNSNTGNGQYALKEWYNQNLALVESGVNTDWLAKPLRNGVGQRHSVRVEGGDQSMRYGVDLMYNDVKGVMKGSDRTSLTGALDLNYRTGRFSFNNILTIVDNVGRNSSWGEFSSYAAMNPYLPYQDQNGNILKVVNTIQQFGEGGEGMVSSPVYNPAYNSLLNITDQNKYTDITNNFNVEYKVSSSLTARGRMTVTKQYNGGDVFFPADHTLFTGSAYTGDNITRRGRYTKTNGELNNFSTNLLLNYTKSFGRSLVSANGGFDANSLSGFSNTYIVEGFPNDNMDFPSLAMQYMLNSRPSGTESTVRDASTLLSANYTYDDRFLFDGSYRGTQSSQFGRNAQWGQFWSSGIGWNLHNESFVKNWGIFDQLRLRATTGYTGSQNFNSSISLATYNYYLQNPYTTSGNGAYLLGLANPDLKWQRKRDDNFGVDVAVLRKFNLRFDYYISTTDGLVTDITLPPSNGFETFKANLGRAENKGFDLRLDYKVFNHAESRNSLSVFAMVSHNKNTIKEISEGLKDWNSKQDTIRSSNAPRLRFEEGQSMNAIWAVPSLGIDPATGREVYTKRDGSVTYNWDPADQVVVGDALPKYYGNFGFNLLLKGWQLTTSFRYQWGGKVYNQTLVDKVENANIYQNVDNRVLTDRWQQPGDVSFFKDIADQTLTMASSRFVEDNNLLALAALDLRYDLDRIATVKKWGFSRVRAGINVSEMVLGSTVRVERGTAYPFARNFQFSLQFMY